MFWRAASPSAQLEESLSQRAGVQRAILSEQKPDGWPGEVCVSVSLSFHSVKADKTDPECLPCWGLKTLKVIRDGAISSFGTESGAQCSG